MSDTYMSDTVIAELKDIGQQEAVLGAQLARLRSRREKIIAGRVKPTERQISEHALIRYMERIEGLDLEAVKSRARAYVLQCQETGVPGIFLHSTGIQVVTNRHGLIVTFLPPGERMPYPSKDNMESPD